MSTVGDIQAALPHLSNEELRAVEQAVRQLYRHRNAGLLFDDVYGVWTEADQTSAAAEAFALFDRAEAGHDQSKAG